MIVTIGEKESTWLQYNLNGKDLTTIGRGNDCDIVLDRISIYSHHAKITKHKDKYYLSGYANDGGIILNGFTSLKSISNTDVLALTDSLIRFSVIRSKDCIVILYIVFCFLGLFSLKRNARTLSTPKSFVSFTGKFENIPPSTN